MQPPAHAFSASTVVQDNWPKACQASFRFTDLGLMLQPRRSGFISPDLGAGCRLSLIPPLPVQASAGPLLSLHATAR